MKPRLRLQLFTLAVSLLAVKVQATERFVALSGGHVAPFTSWADAATNIQAAIDAAAIGDTVTVTNGVFNFGGKVLAGDLTNRIAVDKPILVRSVNGPYQTIIQGAWDPATTNGPTAVRCAWLTNGATLSGFTLRGGATRRGTHAFSNTSTNSGGGVWSASTGSLVTNCIITVNAADYTGGGAFSNTIVNSILLGNMVVTRDSSGTISGGGAQESILKNCALQGNQILSTAFTTYGGGAYRGALTNCLVSGNYAYYAGVYGSPQTPVMNCILWRNTSSSAAATATNYSGSEIIRYSCSLPLPSGTGNIAADPQLLSDGIHLASTSPCRGVGNALYVTGSDIDGQSWSNPPSMGCDEWNAAPLIIAPIAMLPGPSGQLQLSTAVAGQEPLTFIWMKDGVVLADARFGGLGTARLLVNGFGPDDAGSYLVIVSNAFNTATSQVAQVVVRCVSLAASAPTVPYTNWPTAATNIQAAIDAAAVGDIVLVSNGVYNTGGKVMAGDLTNRVAVDKAVIVMSVGGAANTTIEATPGYGGTSAQGSANGTGAIRSVWLGEGAILSGFTVRGGGTRVSSSAALVAINSGGGVWGASASALATYCDIVQNSAYYQGGGVYGGSFANCTIRENAAGQLSGGQYSSSASGGGACNSILNNCLLKGNRAGGAGGGASGGTLNNCTIIGNSVNSGFGNGAKDSVVRNSILWNNSGGSALNNYSGTTIFYSCSPYVAAGNGNSTNNPLFLADGVHLSSASPCRGAGNPAYASGTDVDGQPWTNPPSMGCDEWWPEPLLLSFRQQANTWGQFDFVTSFAGIESSPGYWFKDGSPLAISSHYPLAEATHLTVKGLSDGDTGQYQLVVSNAFGTATSRVANVVVHFVNAGNPGALAPYTNWATAAGNIQDAIDAAADDAVVLVTNGIYNGGGKKFWSWSVTNRVTVDKQATVVSANGPWQTIIEGAWDPVSTLGSNAVRCVMLGSNSSLAGFTLRNGATEASGQGGGVAAYWDELVSSCVLSNNRAYYGGGAAYGTYYDCWFVRNSANSGGATFVGNLSSCTVVENSAGSSGGGVYLARLTNSIVWHNAAPTYPDASPFTATFSCSPSLANTSGNISSNPQLVDGLHLAATSPCRGAGATSLFTAVDLDGDAWLTPPSMGCDEFAAAGMVGPLVASIEASATNVLVNRSITLIGRISGRASGLEWSYGDGPTLANASYFTTHTWTNPGDYTVTLRCFNSDYPDGVTTNLLIHIDPVFAPDLAATSFANGTNFQFQFGGQAGANYSVEYATNLAAPITWLTLKSLTSTGGVVQITDTAATNATRFYRVKAQ